MDKNKSWLGIAYVVTAAFLWSTGGVFIKRIQADPLLITTIRAAIAGLTFLPFLRWKDIQFNRYYWGYVLGYTWMVTSFVIATKLTSAANAIALQYTAPLFLFLYGLVTHTEKPGLRNVVPMLFILLGISCFLLEPAVGTSFLGNLIAISSGVAFASVTVFLRKVGQGGKGLVSISNLMAALLVGLFLPDPAQLRAIDGSAWLGLLYLGSIQMGFSYVLYVRGVLLVRPLQASVLALIEAVLNPVWVFFFWGEAPTIYGLVGGITVLGAVALDLLLRNAAAGENMTVAKERSI